MNFAQERDRDRDRFAARSQPFRKQYSVGDQLPSDHAAHLLPRSVDNDRLYDRNLHARPASPNFADFAHNSRRSSVSSKTALDPESAFRQSAAAASVHPVAASNSARRAHHKNPHLQRRMCQSSLSSSDDEMCTTPELNSCDEFGLESEPVYARPGMCSHAALILLFSATLVLFSVTVSLVICTD
jgi:hypothetical protein